ncbi:MAG: hypothetical protein U0354_01675 [Candidatus Sericytochromatia bacterium]
MVESLLKKALLFQAEIVSLASEKVQEVASSYVEKGTLHDADAKKFVSEVREKLTTTEKDLEEKFGNISKMIQQFSISDFVANKTGSSSAPAANENLDDEITNLERRLEELKLKQEAKAKKKDN